ncbi:multidrug efflux outer membrane protein OprN [Algimonas arctica]|uniref:Multidrug efflux outer membrane protein OprN n=1 Tax=Algimonas arctica TaxID=1479486 RepID=A0A8J3G2M3_9PROT|nr:TolC family protein [Algimonas arctica]GHA97809.1 multidrug efflux outer membrane protein OprN [Algimonas arctica]
MATWLCVSLSACASIDVPSVPEQPALNLESTSFANVPVADTPDSMNDVPNWWTLFDDPVLVDLVQSALSENRDLAVAQANITAADALLKRASLDRSYSTSSGTGLTLDNPTRSSDVDLNLSGTLGASWEIDAFGRIDEQIRAQTFNRDALVQARRDVAVLVASQTAQAYVDLRSAQQRLGVAQENAALQAEGLSLLNELVDAGRSNDLDLNRSRALYLTTRASLPAFRAAVASATARLNALTGAYASGDEKKGRSIASEQGAIPQHVGAMAIGSPATLVRRRPDIRAAEARVGERLALGEVERARLFPTLSFNADIGAFFGSFGDVTEVNSLGFGIGPALSWEGPDLRRVRADIDVTDAQTEAAFAAYEQTVFTALSEVETALALYAGEVERRDDLAGATDAARNALKLARLRFDEGLDDFLDVLDAQRTLLDAQDDLVQNDTLITTYAISAYRALGGMWTDAELDALGQPTETVMRPDVLPVESLTP